MNVFATKVLSSGVVVVVSSKAVKVIPSNDHEALNSSAASKPPSCLSYLTTILPKPEALTIFPRVVVPLTLLAPGLASAKVPELVHPVPGKGNVLGKGLGND